MINILSVVNEEGIQTVYKGSEVEKPSTIEILYKLEDREKVVETLKNIVNWIEEK